MLQWQHILLCFFNQNWEFSLSRKSKECTKSYSWLWLALVRVESITAVHHKCDVSLAPVGNLVLSPALSRSQEEIWLNLLWICYKIFQSLFEWHSLFSFSVGFFSHRRQINHVLGKHFTCRVRLSNVIPNVPGCRLFNNSLTIVSLCVPSDLFLLVND